MPELDDEHVITYMKHHPNVIERYMKENCSRETLKYLAKKIELFLNETKSSQESLNMAGSTVPEKKPNRDKITEYSHFEAINSSLPGTLVLGHDYGTKSDMSAAFARLSGQRDLANRFMLTLKSKNARGWTPRSRRFREINRIAMQEKNTECTRRLVAKGDMTENEFTNPTSSPNVSNRLLTNATLRTTQTSWDTSSRNLASLNGRDLSQSNQYTAAEPDISSGAATYHPLRRSISVSSQILKTTKSGCTNMELIFSDLTASLCERVPVDGSNLYLVDPETNRLYLQPPNEPIRGSRFALCSFEIGSRTTFACYVAECGQPLCRDDLPKELRFQQPVVATPVTPKHVFAHPIKNADGKLIGVIELYRSASRRAFSEAEKQIITTIVHWARLVLESNEKLLALSKALKAGDFILEIIRNLFCKVRNMDSVIKAIMEHAKELVKADRVTLFLVDSKKNELYPSILDMGDMKSSKFVHHDSNTIRIPITEGFAGYVVRTGHGIRSNDVYKDSRFYRKIDELQNHVTKSILAMPLFDDTEVVGVLEMINKVKGDFTDEDERLLDVYSTYCGLAINVARMYDRIYRSDKKYRVAMEVLTYHSLVSEKEVEQYESCTIPENITGIAAYDFSPWTVEEKDEVPFVCFMLYDLAGSIRLDKKTVVRFILTVRKNYRPISYHNWDHGMSVAHSMYYLLKTGVHPFTELEKVSLLIACLCHDLDHRGYDNRFMKKFSTPLAALYSSSPMEHHHFNMTVTILQQRGHNIFMNFKSGSYRNILAVIKHAILSTDLATFWTARKKMEDILDSEAGIDWSQESHRMSVISIAMPTCDLCAMYKPWDTQVRVVMLIMEEFWAQGDREKASDSKPLSLMDRDEAVQLADGQVGFIRGICLPCYTTIARIWPTVKVIVDAVQENLSRWESIAQLSYEQKECLLFELMQQRFPKSVERMKLNLVETDSSK